MKRFCVLALSLLLIICFILSGCTKEQDNSYASLYAEANPDAYEYEEASTDCYGYVLKQPLLCSGLICCYSALADEFVENHPEYETDMPVNDRLEFRKRLLEEIDTATGKTNKKVLQEKAVAEYEQMMILYVRSTYKEMGLTVEKMDSIRNQWKMYGIRYYDTLKETNSEIQSPDDAMRVMVGCNVLDVVNYAKMQSLANEIASTAFYDLVCTNEELEGYYNENVNKYRLVEVRAVYFKEEATALKVKDLMQKNPEDIDNLAKAYNEKKYLAETSGVVQVNSSCNKVPEAVKQWAYTQTEDTLFEKHGKIELVRGEDGWYLLMCEGIKGFDTKLGDVVYKAVVQDFKSQLMDNYINTMRPLQEYELRSMDYQKAYDVLDSVY